MEYTFPEFFVSFLRFRTKQQNKQNTVSVLSQQQIACFGLALSFARRPFSTIREEASHIQHAEQHSLIQ
jgi:hypothetical protein